MVSYCTLAEVKTAITNSGDTIGTEHDARLTAVIARVSRAIDLHTRRLNGAYAVTADMTRYFNGTGDDFLPLGEFSLAALPSALLVAETGIVDNDAGTGGTYTAWGLTDAMAWPFNNEANGIPIQALMVDNFNGTKGVWPGYARGVKITGKFGFSQAVPSAINQAAILQSFAWYKHMKSFWADPVKMNELGANNLLTLNDNEAIGLIAPYVRLT